MSKRETTEDKPSLGAELARLGAELAAVEADEAARAEKVQEVEDLLGNMPIKDFEALAESPLIQRILAMLPSDNLRPGEVRNRGTLAEREREWTIEDINRMVKSGEMPLKRFVPVRSMAPTFQGVQIAWVADGTEIEVPECFYNIYREAMEAERNMERNIAYRMGRDVQPHKNWLTPEGESVRHWSLLGKQYGGQGGHMGVGRISEDSGEGGE